MKQITIQATGRLRIKAGEIIYRHGAGLCMCTAVSGGTFTLRQLSANRWVRMVQVWWFRMWMRPAAPASGGAGISPVLTNMNTIIETERRKGTSERAIRRMVEKKFGLDVTK